MTVDLPGRARVDWAVESKHPGAAMGYTLLSGSIDGVLALRLIEAGTTGTPVAENAGHIDALPWVSFTADGIGVSAVLGVVVREWSNDQDVTGQTIVPSRLLVVGWPSSRAALPGFVSLLALASRVRWTAVDGPPAGVHGAAPIATTPPAALNIARIVKTIDEEVGFPWVLSVAVALLDGEQVAIVTPQQVFDLQQRAGLLDAVCALLPYGCRAWISAATWARDRSAHPVRLSFAEHGRSGQLVIDFDQVRQTTPRSAEAVAYLAEMNLLRSEGVSTAKIVEHLTTLYEPLEPENAAHVVKHLKELRLVASTLEDIRNGEGDPERVDEVLTRYGWHDLSPANVAIIASFLVDTAGTGRSGRAAGEVLHRHWSRKAALSYGDMIVNDLRDDIIERPRQRVATLAALSDDVRDEVVVTVLRQTAPAVDPDVAKRTVALLVETRSLSIENTPAWEVLARCPELGARLVRAMSDLRTKGRGVHFRKLMGALAPCQHMPEARWVMALRYLLDAGKVDSAIGSFPAPVLALAYDVAVAGHQLRRLFAEAWSYVLLLAYTPDGRGGHPNLKEIAKQVVEGTTVLGPQARAAAKLLALGVDRTPLLEVGDHQDLPPLAEAWSVLPEAARATLGGRLPAAVLGKTMTPESFRTLVAVTDALDPVDHRRPGVTGLWDQAAAEVGQRLIRHPELLPTLALDEQWANDLVRYAPQYAWLTQWFVVRRVASTAEVDTADIGDSYARLRSAGTPPSTAVRAVAPWLARRGPEGLGELLGSFGPPPDDRYRDEIRLGAFTEPELHGLGDAYERILLRQRDDHLRQLRHVDQERSANHDLRVKHNLPLPDDLVSPSADPSAALKREKLGLLKQAWHKVTGDH